MRLVSGGGVDPEQPLQRRRLALIVITALIVWRGEDAATIARYLAGRTAANDAAPRSLAVLAFDNLSGVPADSYISDGISEELTDVLGRLPNLRVAARTSAFHFRNAKTPIPEIGRHLGVGYVVEGSVRRSAERIRINVRLVSTQDGSSLWAESYDRDFKDLLLVQNEIALVIARKLELQIKRIDLASSRASDAEAQRLYFEASQAIFEQTLAGLDKAEVLLKRALTIDSGFVLARVRLQDVAWNRAMVRRAFARVHRDSPEALQMIEDARAVVASAPNLAEAHISLSAHLFANWQREEAMAVMRRSIALNPNIAVAHQYLSVQLLSDGRMGEALDEMARAVELDPLAANRLGWYARVLVLAGQPERALVYVDRALALRPNVASFHDARATALGDLGRDGEMLAELKSFRIGGRLASSAWTALAKASARSNPELAERLHEGVALPASSDPYDGPVMPLLAVGRPSEALAAIRDVDQFQVTDLPLLAFYRPGWDPVRNTPEFAALLAKLDFTEAHARAQSLARGQSSPSGPVGRRLGSQHLHVADFIIAQRDDVARLLIGPIPKVLRHGHPPRAQHPQNHRDSGAREQMLQCMAADPSSE